MRRSCAEVKMWRCRWDVVLQMFFTKNPSQTLSGTHLMAVVRARCCPRKTSTVCLIGKHKNACSSNTPFSTKLDVDYICVATVSMYWLTEFLFPKAFCFEKDWFSTTKNRGTSPGRGRGLAQLCKVRRAYEVSWFLQITPCNLSHSCWSHSAPSPDTCAAGFPRAKYLV